MIVGTNGTTINALKQSTKAHCFIEQETPDRDTARVTCVGAASEVEEAKNTVANLIEGKITTAQIFKKAGMVMPAAEEERGSKDDGPKMSSGGGQSAAATSMTQGFKAEKAQSYKKPKNPPANPLAQALGPVITPPSMPIVPPAQAAMMPAPTSAAGGAPGGPGNQGHGFVGEEHWPHPEANKNLNDYYQQYWSAYQSQMMSGGFKDNEANKAAQQAGF